MSISSYIDCKTSVQLHDYDFSPVTSLLILLIYFDRPYHYGEDFLIYSMLLLLQLETIHLNRVKLMKY